MHVRITTPQEVHALSVHLQDALVPRSFINWDPEKGEFSMILNRYIWESHSQQRINSCLHFHNVKEVNTKAIDQGLKQKILNLLAIRYDNKKILFYFSDHRSLSIQADNIDIEFWDYDNAWPTEKMPKHHFKI